MDTSNARDKSQYSSQASFEERHLIGLKKHRKGEFTPNSVGTWQTKTKGLQPKVESKDLKKQGLFHKSLSLDPKEVTELDVYKIPNNKDRK